MRRLSLPVRSIFKKKPPQAASGEAVRLKIKIGQYHILKANRVEHVNIREEISQIIRISLIAVNLRF